MDFKNSFKVSTMSAKWEFYFFNATDMMWHYMPKRSVVALVAVFVFLQVVYIFTIYFS